MDKDEEWKPALGYENLYEVSSWGRVKSLGRITRGKNSCPVRRKGRILKQQPTLGYVRVVFYDESGRPKVKKVHSIVAEAFLGERPKGKFACHKNGIKTDNRRENLYWGTPKQNSADRFAHGNTICGEQNKNAKLKDKDAEDILRLLGNGHSRQELAKRYNVGVFVIRSIAVGSRWKHVKGSRQTATKRTPFSDATVRRIRKLRSEGASVQELVDRFGTTFSNICMILRRESYKHIR
jgi:uncharacterized protein (DUF433 family)